jgi:hypothetical protein
MGEAAGLLDEAGLIRQRRWLEGDIVQVRLCGVTGHLLNLARFQIRQRQRSKFFLVVPSNEAPAKDNNPGLPEIF